MSRAGGSIQDPWPESALREMILSDEGLPPLLHAKCRLVEGDPTGTKAEAGRSTSSDFDQRPETYRHLLGFPIVGAAEASVHPGPGRDEVPWRYQRQRDSLSLRSVASTSSEGLSPEPVTR